MINYKMIGLACALGLSGHMASATTIGGIEFPDGAASFADKLIDFRLGDGVRDDFADPENVLGIPDYVGPDSVGTGSFSLGNPGRTPDNLADDLFGFVTVQFTDNSLTTSGDNGADLFIFETGGSIERYMVEISMNNIDWINAGSVTGQPSSIDIDGVVGVNAGDRFSYVRVSDIAGGSSTGAPYGGPDIDAIGAISSAPAVPAVPLPAAGWMLLAGLAGLAGFKRRS